MKNIKFKASWRCIEKFGLNILPEDIIGQARACHSLLQYVIYEVQFILV
jgi:hypothetical protein